MRFERLNQPLQSVLLMELDDEELVQRLLARGRADDNEEVIRHRLSVYREQTAPLINHYEQRGQLKGCSALARSRPWPSRSTRLWLKAP